MTAFWNSKMWRVMAGDVMSGLRYVSHNTLALLGLAAVTAAVFLAGRADLQHQLESRVLGWLVERSTARTAEAAPGPDNNDILLAMAEPEAIVRATALDPAELNRQQMAVVTWISRRYSVAQEPISRLVQEAWAVGKMAGMEPTLILAVMAVESSFNPFAQSHVGAQGLMQVMTGIHHDKYEIFGGRRAAFDPVTNLRVGVQVLQDCIRRAGSLQAGLKYYVGAANLADDGGYAIKVLAEQAYLRQVAAGGKVPTTAPLPRAGVLIQASVTTPVEPPSAGVSLPHDTVVPAAAPAASAMQIPPAIVSKPAQMAVPAAPAASAGGASPVAPLVPAAPMRQPEQVAMIQPA